MTPTRIRQGDIGYVSLWVPDLAKAQEFYTAVLDWRLSRGSSDEHRLVEGVHPSHGLIRLAGGKAYLREGVDDQGTVFAMYEPVAGDDQRPPVNGLNQGDVSYVTMHVVDSAKARAFYGAVLGWQFQPGTVPDGWQVPDIAPMAGMAGGASAPVTMPMYRVDDVRAAVERIRAAGGTATDPMQHPYGWTSDCADNQGTRFYVGQH